MDPRFPVPEDDGQWGSSSPGGGQGMRDGQGFNIAGGIDQPKTWWTNCDFAFIRVSMGIDWQMKSMSKYYILSARLEDGNKRSTNVQSWGHISWVSFAWESVHINMHKWSTDLKITNWHVMLLKNIILNDKHIIRISLEQQSTGDSITKEESKLVRDFTEESMRPTAGEGFEVVCGAWLVEGQTPMSTRWPAELSRITDILPGQANPQFIPSSGPGPPCYGIRDFTAVFLSKKAAS